MKTIHVVAVVIEAVDEQGKEILFATPKRVRRYERQLGIPRWKN